MGHSRLPDSQQGSIAACSQLSLAGRIGKLTAALLQPVPEDQILQVENPAENLKSPTFPLKLKLSKPEFIRILFDSCSILVR
jgi:hypothetical protein